MRSYNAINTGARASAEHVFFLKTQQNETKLKCKILQSRALEQEDRWTEKQALSWQHLTLKEPHGSGDLILFLTGDIKMIYRVIIIYTWVEKEYQGIPSANNIAVDIPGMLSAFLRQRLPCERVLDVPAVKNPGLS